MRMFNSLLNPVAGVLTVLLFGAFFAHQFQALRGLTAMTEWSMSMRMPNLVFGWTVVVAIILGIALRRRDS